LGGVRHNFDNILVFEHVYRLIGNKGIFVEFEENSVWCILVKGELLLELIDEVTYLWY
jgi:hypothetical protein